MKKYISILVLLLSVQFLSAQCLTKLGSVSTPCGRRANGVNTGSDLSLASANSLRITAQNDFPCSTWRRHATWRYNCYAYAFHISNNQVQNEQWLWINDPSPYYTGCPPCYRNSTGITGDKARYYVFSGGPIQHAACVWPTTQRYTSKWGAWPLLEHPPTCVPPSYGLVINFVRRTGFTASEVSSQVSNQTDAYELKWEFEQEQLGVSGFNIMYVEGEEDSYYLNNELIPVNSFEVIQKEGDRYGYTLDNSEGLDIQKVYLEIVYNDGSVEMVPFEG